MEHIVYLYFLVRWLDLSPAETILQPCLAIVYNPGLEIGLGLKSTLLVVSFSFLYECRAYIAYTFELRANNAFMVWENFYSATYCVSNLWQLLIDIEPDSENSSA